jgi:hypothetical protein
MPSLEEAAEELRTIVLPPTYDPAATNEVIARQQAYYAGQLWVIDKLISLHAKYQKGGG